MRTQGHELFLPGIPVRRHLGELLPACVASLSDEIADDEDRRLDVEALEQRKEDRVDGEIRVVEGDDRHVGVRFLPSAPDVDEVVDADDRGGPAEVDEVVLEVVQIPVVPVSGTPEHYVVVHRHEEPRIGLLRDLGGERFRSLAEEAVGRVLVGDVPVPDGLQVAFVDRHALKPCGKVNGHGRFPDRVLLGRRARNGQAGYRQHRYARKHGQTEPDHVPDDEGVSHFDTISKSPSRGQPDAEARRDAGPDPPPCPPFSLPDGHGGRRPGRRHDPAAAGMEKAPCPSRAVRPPDGATGVQAWSAHFPERARETARSVGRISAGACSCRRWGAVSPPLSLY